MSSIVIWQQPEKANQNIWIIILIKMKIDVWDWIMSKKLKSNKQKFNHFIYKKRTQIIIFNSNFTQ